VKLCTKNYENPSMFVKVTAKKSVAPFFLDTVYNGKGRCVCRASQHVSGVDGIRVVENRFSVV